MADSDVPTQDTGGSAEATLVPPAPLTLEAPPSGGTVAVGIPGRTGFERTRTIVVYTLLFAIALLYFVPFLWMLSTSLKTLPETAHFDLLPKHPTLQAYRDAFTHVPLRPLRGEQRRAGGDRDMPERLSLLARRLRVRPAAVPRARGAVLAVLVTLMIPDQLRLVPIFVMFTNWHLLGHYHGYVLIKLAMAAQLFLMRQYFLTIPRDLEEAAKLDGAGYFKTFWKVMLPLAGPGDRRRRDPRVRGHVERLLLAADHLQHRARPLHAPRRHLLVRLRVPDAVAAADGEQRDRDRCRSLLLYVFFQRYFVAGVASAGVKG